MYNKANTHDVWGHFVSIKINIYTEHSNGDIFNRTVPFHRGLELIV